MRIVIGLAILACTASAWGSESKEKKGLVEQIEELQLAAQANRAKARVTRSPLLAEHYRRQAAAADIVRGVLEHESASASVPWDGATPVSSTALKPGSELTRSEPWPRGVTPVTRKGMAESGLVKQVSWRGVTPVTDYGLTKHVPWGKGVTPVTGYGLTRHVPWGKGVTPVTARPR